MTNDLVAVCFLYLWLILYFTNTDNGPLYIAKDDIRLGGINLAIRKEATLVFVTIQDCDVMYFECIGERLSNKALEDILKVKQK